MTFSRVDTRPHSRYLPYTTQTDERCTTGRSRAPLSNLSKGVTAVDKVGIWSEGNGGAWFERDLRSACLT